MTDWPFASLVPMKYGAILADPPWRQEMRSEKGYAKSPQAHYATMSTEELAALPVSHLAGPDCYLFLWAIWPMLPDALDLMRAWGFAYVTGGNWNKRTPSGKTVMSTGYVLRGASEPFLIGRIGRPETASKGERGLIDAPGDVPDTIEAVRREHSRKPPEMRCLIDRLLPRQHFCELFARELWPGHDVWGNETAKFGGDNV